MCLGVPGRITEIRPDPHGMTMGRVRFGGVSMEVCLAYVPEAVVGDYVLVHVGFALSRLDEDDALGTLAMLAQMGEPADAVASASDEPGSGGVPE